MGEAGMPQGPEQWCCADECVDWGWADDSAHRALMEAGSITGRAPIIGTIQPWSVQAHLQALLQDLAGDTDAGADDGAGPAGNALHLRCVCGDIVSNTHARRTVQGAVSVSAVVTDQQARVNCSSADSTCAATRQQSIT